MKMITLHIYKDHIISPVSIIVDKIEAVEDISWRSGSGQSMVYTKKHKFNVEESRLDIIKAMQVEELVTDITKEK